jgi:hypothetical protein
MTAACWLLRLPACLLVVVGRQHASSQIHHRTLCTLSSPPLCERRPCSRAQCAPRAAQDVYRSGMGTHMGSVAPPSMYPGSNYYSGMAPSMGGGPGSHYAGSQYAGPGSQYASPGSQYAGPGSHYGQGSQISPSLVQMPSPYYAQQ